MATTLDDDYEEPQFRWHPQRYWNTTLRRYETHMVSELFLGRITRSEPPLEIDLSVIPERVAFKPQNSGRKSKVKGLVETALKEAGCPLSATEIVEMIGKIATRKMVSAYLINHPDRFQRLGRTSGNHTLYALDPEYVLNSPIENERNTI